MPKRSPQPFANLAADGASAGGFSCPAEQAAQNLERKELERLTREAVDTLDTLTREIFLRYYYRWEKTAQIAQALGLNLSTVKTRLARGREKLRNILQERGVTHEDVV